MNRSSETSSSASSNPSRREFINFQFCPNIDTLTADSPPPVPADAAGRYPAPVAGVWSEV